MTIKVCKRYFEDPVECQEFNKEDFDLTCTYQLKNLRDGLVLVNDEGDWMKREDAIKKGFGTEDNPFILGVNVDGTGYPEPDWEHMHSTCLVNEIQSKNLGKDSHTKKMIEN